MVLKNCLHSFIQHFLLFLLLWNQSNFIWCTIPDFQNISKTVIFNYEQYIFQIATALGLPQNVYLEW